MELATATAICVPDIGGAEPVEVKIIVRPERMRVWGEPDGEDISRVHGTIAEVVYLGSMTQLIIDLQTGERVTVHELNDDLKGALPEVGDPGRRPVGGREQLRDRRRRRRERRRRGSPSPSDSNGGQRTLLRVAGCPRKERVIRGLLPRQGTEDRPDSG